MYFSLVPLDYRRGWRNSCALLLLLGNGLLFFRCYDFERQKRDGFSKFKTRFKLEYRFKHANPARV